MNEYTLCITEDLNFNEVLKGKKFIGSISKETPEIIDELNRLNEENKILKYAFEETMKKISINIKNSSQKEIINKIENIYYEKLKEKIL